MRALVQRVRRASVRVGEDIAGEIGPGLAILLGVTHGDGPSEADRLAEKVAYLRIFEDEAGKMNLSLLDTGGAALVVPQFTLYAGLRRGRRPDFTAAAPPALARPLVDRFADALRRSGIRQVETGIFGGHMLVEIWNDGPVTIMVDTGEM